MGERSAIARKKRCSVDVQPKLGVGESKFRKMGWQVGGTKGKEQRLENTRKKDEREERNGRRKV